jgi:hypothetical protein
VSSSLCLSAWDRAQTRSGEEGGEARFDCEPRKLM